MEVRSFVPLGKRLSTVGVWRYPKQMTWPSAVAASQHLEGDYQGVPLVTYRPRTTDWSHGSRNWRATASALAGKSVMRTRPSTYTMPNTRLAATPTRPGCSIRSLESESMVARRWVLPALTPSDETFCCPADSSTSDWPTAVLKSRTICSTAARNSDQKCSRASRRGRSSSTRRRFSPSAFCCRPVHSRPSSLIQSSVVRHGVAP